MSNPFSISSDTTSMELALGNYILTAAPSINSSIEEAQTAAADAAGSATVASNAASASQASASAAAASAATAAGYLNPATTTTLGAISVSNGLSITTGGALSTTLLSVAGRVGAVTLKVADITDIGSNYAPLLNPVFQGTVNIPAGAVIPGYLTTSAAAATYVPSYSPTFTGVPIAPTAAPGTNTTQLATTACVLAAVTASTTGVSLFNGRTGNITLTSTDVNAALGYTAANPANVLATSNNLSDLASASAARTNLGLAGMATQASNAVAVTGGSIDGATVGATTPAAGKFTTLSASTAIPVSSGGTGLNSLTAHGVLIGEGTSNVTTAVGTNGQMLLGLTGADPVFGNNPTITGGSIDGAVIGASNAQNGTFALVTAGNLTITGGGTTTLNGPLYVGGAVSGNGFIQYLGSPPNIGTTTPAQGAFTSLTASSSVGGTGFSNYFAAPPSLGGTTPNAGKFTTLTVTTTLTVPNTATLAVAGALGVGGSFIPTVDSTIDIGSSADRFKNLWMNGLIVNPDTVVTTGVSGTQVTVAATTSVQVVTFTGTLAQLEIMMPTAVADGHTFSLTIGTGSITSLIWGLPGSGQHFFYTPASTSGTITMKFVWVASTSTWYNIA